MNKNQQLFIDAEWYIGGDVFLIGHAQQKSKPGQLYDENLNQLNFEKQLKGVDYIFCYGPDIGILEAHFGIELKNKYVCVNLLKIFRRTFFARSYKLAHIEKMFGIKRTQVEYKKSVFEIWRDWKNPERKARLLEYNREDVVNLLQLWQMVQKRYKITNNYLIDTRL